MAEITNNTLAVLVFAALAVVLAGSLFTFGGGITGFAPVDTGVVNLTIEEALHIQVDANNDTIDFGNCAPRVGSYWCATNDTLACDGVAGGNCTGDTTAPQFLNIENVGNVDANVNITSSCTAAQLIGGTSPLFQYITTNCPDGNAQGTWTDLDGTSRIGCSNLTVGSTGASGFRMYANVTIPQDASQSCQQSTITFTAISN